MDHPVPGQRRRWSSLAWAVTAVLLLGLGSSFLVAGLSNPVDPLAAIQPPVLHDARTTEDRVGARLTAPGAALSTDRDTSPTTRSSQPPPSGAGRTHPATRSSVAPPAPPHPAAPAAPAKVPHSIPVGLMIPAINLDVSLTTLGLNADGTVEVPDNPALPGWFDLGPTPGQRGSAVILGHVDSSAGPAVFYLLRLLSPGDQIAVRLRNGSVAHFVVSSMATYANADFPNERVYTAHGFAGLHLVTCGGGFDYSVGHYLGNLVVYTRLVDITGGAAGPA